MHVVLAALLATLSALAGTRTGFTNNADYAPLADLLDSAQTSVQMELYEMDDPAVIASLRAAMDRGVRLEIVQEPSPVGASCHVFDAGSTPSQKFAPPHHASGAVPCEDLQQLVVDVNAAGGHYIPFLKSALCPNGKSCFQHGKVAVIDGQKALVTTGNFNVSNLCDRAASPATCDRDYSYVTEDANVIAGLQAIIDADAGGARYDLRHALPKGAEAKLTVGTLALDSLVAFIGSATKSIQVENQYLKEPTLNAALTGAAQRGVKVEVMVASACAFGKPRPNEVAQLTQIFQGFDNAGITTRMFTRNITVGGYKGYLHAKAIVVDGKKAWLGSSNGSTESLFQNREFGVYFDGASDVKGLQQNLSSDFADANSETWQDSLACAENNK